MADDVIKHEIAHLCGMAVELAAEPRFHDTQVLIAFDEHGRGEFAPSISKHSQHNGTVDDATREKWVRAGAIGPVGLMRDADLLSLFASAGNWVDVLRAATGFLSAEDLRLASKGVSLLHIGGPEEIAPLFGLRALESVDPERLKLLVDVIKRHNRLPMMPIKAVIPRAVAQKMRTHAMERATELFQMRQLARFGGKAA